MKLKVTLLFCLLTVTLTYAQYDWTKGELILKSGDTLKGLIKLPMVSKNMIAFNGKEKVKFKKNRRSGTEKLDENEVDLVIFKNSDTEIAYFKYIPISKRKKGLFKIITSGKVSLYARKVSVAHSTVSYNTGINSGVMNSGVWTYWTYAFSNFNEFYVLRKNEIIASPMITVRISRSFKKRATAYFSDCPELVSKLENKTYVANDIKEVVDEYNKCQ
ncbi:hypothetical protein ACG2LH_08450 [Zhouia sp. PK063]|uniref:hypothetical protein n=1 Tax=Zhouia sp. PK063 TaxID=3373602 RepID=UPI00378C3632